HDFGLLTCIGSTNAITWSGGLFSCNSITTAAPSSFPTRRSSDLGLNTFSDLASVSRSTTTQATSTNFFATTASTTNLSGVNLNGFGLLTCKDSTNAITWYAGRFSCNSITTAASSTLLTDTNNFTG